MFSSRTSCCRLIFRRFCHSLKSNHVISTECSAANEEKLKSLRIAILGLPNVGKSTLINQLVHRPICAASSKVHTTRVNVRAVYTENDTQLVFVDTPGLVTPSHRKKFNLEETFELDVKNALNEVNVVGIIQDMTHPKAREVISARIMNVIKFANQETPFILILNKIDKLKRKNLLLDVVKNLTTQEDYPKFEDIFMISALSGNGVDDLRNYFLDLAKPNLWDFDKDVHTDQSAMQIIERTVKAKAFDCLKDEVPYLIKVTTEHFDYLEDGSIKAGVLIQSPIKRLVKIIKGRGGKSIGTIAKSAEQDLCNIFHTNVILRVIIEE